MLLQRARGAENRVKHRSSNGPRRAQSKVLRCGKHFKPSILRRVAYVSCRGYVGILLSAQSFLTVNQGGTADKDFIRP